MQNNERLLYTLQLPKQTLVAKYGPHATPLSVLCTGKSDQIAFEFLKSLRTGRCFQEERTCGKFIAGYVGGVCFAAAEYNVRITDRVACFPYANLWLVESESEVRCPGRKRSPRDY